MQFDDLIRDRRSIRGYKPGPVPKALIAEILELPMRIPSSSNTRPGNFHAVTGESLARIRADDTENMMTGVLRSREFRIGPVFAGPTVRGRVGRQAAVLGMGIACNDKEGRHDWVMRGLRQFTRRPASSAPTSACSMAATTPHLWLGSALDSQGTMQSLVVREQCRRCGKPGPHQERWARLA